MYFKLVLALLPFAVSASPNIPRQSSPSLASSCDSPTLVQASIFEVNGNNITHSYYSCSDTTASKRSLGKRDFFWPFWPPHPPAPIWPPIFGPCPYPPPGRQPQPIESACGETETLACGVPAETSLTSPIPDDCQVLVDSIGVLVETEGPTYTIEAGLIDQISYQSCVSSVTNTYKDTLEFCFSDRATDITNICNDCFDTGAGNNGQYNASSYSHLVFRGGS